MRQRSVFRACPIIHQPIENVGSFPCFRIVGMSVATHWKLLALGVPDHSQVTDQGVRGTREDTTGSVGGFRQNFMRQITVFRRNFGASLKDGRDLAIGASNA